MKNSVDKDKLKKYISREPSDWMEQADYYEVNKDWLDKSAMIAIKILVPCAVSHYSKSISRKPWSYTSIHK